MFKGIKHGIGLAIGLLLIPAFALTVGSLKVWSPGETLTATDINGVVSTLKTAVESASQMQYMKISATSQDRFASIIDNGADSLTTTESLAQMSMPRSGTLKNVLVRVPQNTCTSSPVLTLRNNGVDTTVAYTVSAGTVNFAPTAVVQTLTYTSGDKLSWKANCPNGSVTFTVTYDF